jgi:hypothetical protein
MDAGVKLQEGSKVKTIVGKKDLSFMNPFKQNECQEEEKGYDKKKEI